MAGEHEAWIKKMVQIFGDPDSDDAANPSSNGTPTTGSPPDGSGANGAPSSGGKGSPSSPGSGNSTGSGNDADSDKSGTIPPKGGDSTASPEAGGATPPAATGGTAPSSGGTSSGSPTSGKGTSDPRASSGGPAPSAAASTPPSTADSSPAINYANLQDALKAAQKAATEISTNVDKATPLLEEIKKASEAASAGKKSVESADRDAVAAEKGMPAAPQIPTPQGKDPHAQYDSSIQITGDIRKVQQDADAKADAIREQNGITGEGNTKVQRASDTAMKIAATLTELSNAANARAQEAAAAASAAKLLAAGSKKDSDQAAKEKTTDAADRVALGKEDAKVAGAVQEAAAKAQAAAKQLATAVAGVSTEAKRISESKQATTTALDARKKQLSGLDTKMKPYADAVDKASQQETECQSKLSKEDADAILTKRYETLGGDGELTKALEAEDKAFDTESDKFHVQMKEVNAKTIRQLDDFKVQLEQSIKTGDEMMPKYEEWAKREEATSTQTMTAAKALGQKLETTPGKELMYDVGQQTEFINKVKSTNERNQKSMEKTKAAMHALEERYRAASQQYSASEKYIAERRTEVNNLLQIQNMSLQQKVEYLQNKPKPVRDRIQKQIENEIERVVRMSVADTESETADFVPAPQLTAPTPIDWKPITDRITKFQTMSLEDMKKDDPKLAGIQEEYDQAGGDQALFEKRVAEWKKQETEAEEAEKSLGEDHRKRTDRMRTDFDDSNQGANKMQDTVRQYKKIQAEKEARLAEIKKKVDPKLGHYGGLSQSEIAEYELLEKDIPSYKTDADNLDGESAMRDFSKNTAAALLEQERQLYEATLERYKRPKSKPTSVEIQGMPLRAKYAELAGKSAP